MKLLRLLLTVNVVFRPGLPLAHAQLPQEVPPNRLRGSLLTVAAHGNTNNTKAQDNKQE